MAPTQTHELVIRHDGVDRFAFTDTAYGVDIRVRASGRRTLVADHHEHLLHIHLVLDNGGRELRANKSGSVAEFLAMRPDRRAGAVARVVARARFPPACADGVARLCELAARAACQRRCDDVTVTVDWTPALKVGVGDARHRCGTEVARDDEDAGAGLLQFAWGLCKDALGYFGVWIA